MAQFVVRNLEDDVGKRLRALAESHGRSVEEELRQIIRQAVSRPKRARGKLGTRMASRFAKRRLRGDIEEWRGHAARPADLGK